MNKEWQVKDDNCWSEGCDSLEEALTCANAYLEEYRADARADGEWNESIENLTIYRAAYCAQISHTGEGGAVDYAVLPLAQVLPPMDAEMAWILGRPNFTLIGFAKRLRELGHEINTRSEDEQAAVIYWMLNLYLQYGERWKVEANKYLALKEEAPKPA